MAATIDAELRVAALGTELADPAFLADAFRHGTEAVARTAAGARWRRRAIEIEKVLPKNVVVTRRTNDDLTNRRPCV